jgi:hypothetical protein
MGYKKQAAKKNKDKKKERPVVVRSHTGIKYDGIRTDMKPSKWSGSETAALMNTETIRILKKEGIAQ